MNEFGYCISNHLVAEIATGEGHFHLRMSASSSSN